MSVNGKNRELENTDDPNMFSEPKKIVDKKYRRTEKCKWTKNVDEQKIPVNRNDAERKCLWTKINNEPKMPMKRKYKWTKK